MIEPVCPADHYTGSNPLSVDGKTEFNFDLFSGPEFCWGGEPHSPQAKIITPALDAATPASHLHWTFEFAALAYPRLRPRVL